MGVPYTGATGRTPDQCGSTRSSGSSFGPLYARLRRDLLQIHPDDGGRGQLLRARPAGVLDAARNDGFHDRVEGPDTLLVVDDLVRDAVRHHRAVVDGVVEGRLGQHQAVHMRHRHADRQAGIRLACFPQGARSGRTVHVEALTHARVQRRQHDGSAVADEPQMADVAVVEDRVHQLPVVGHALPGAGGGGALGAGVGGGDASVRCRSGKLSGSPGGCCAGQDDSLAVVIALVHTVLCARRLQDRRQGRS